MIDKKISLGTLITILTVLGTFIYTQGMMTNKVASFENESDKQVKRVQKTEEDVVQLQIAVAKIETKIDEGFKRIETLFIEN